MWLVGGIFPLVPSYGESGKEGMQMCRREEDVCVFGSWTRSCLKEWKISEGIISSEREKEHPQGYYAMEKVLSLTLLSFYFLTRLLDWIDFGSQC